MKNVDFYTSDIYQYASQKNYSTSWSLFIPVNWIHIRMLFLLDSTPSCEHSVTSAALFTHISIWIAVQSDFCVHVNINMVDGKQAQLEISEASGSWRKS